MCCFSPIQPLGLLARLFAPGPAKLRVSATRIFARVDGAAREQWLAYSMEVATPADVAMVLPLPVARAADDALTFVDLSGYPQFFDHLQELFLPPAAVASAAKGRSFVPRLPRPKLVVHEVGNFEASYVPRLSDMDRLDERFRIPELVWRRRPEYAGFGFAVFKLKKGKTKTIHPMAMRFPVANTDELFFPTVHVHDGELHDHAKFDHDLYAQLLDGVAPGTAMMQAPIGIDGGVSIERAKGLVVPKDRVFKLPLHGKRANEDTRVALARYPVAA